MYIHAIHNNSKTYKVKWYKLVVRGNMFEPHCGHLQANFHKSSAFNVHTIWDPIVCKILSLLHMQHGLYAIQLCEKHN